MRHKSVKLQQGDVTNDTTTIFGTGFPGTHAQTQAVRDNCIITVLALLALVALLFISVFTLHLL